MNVHSFNKLSEQYLLFTGIDDGTNNQYHTHSMSIGAYES